MPFFLRRGCMRNDQRRRGAEPESRPLIDTPLLDTPPRTYAAHIREDLVKALTGGEKKVDEKSCLEAKKKKEHRSRKILREHRSTQKSSAHTHAPERLFKPSPLSKRQTLDRVRLRNFTVGVFLLVTVLKLAHPRTGLSKASVEYAFFPGQKIDR